MCGSPSKLRSVAAAALVTSVGVAGAIPLTARPARAYELLISGGGAPVRWFVPEVTFTLGATTSDDFDVEALPAVLEAAFDQWAATSCGLAPEITYAGRSAASAPTAFGAGGGDNVVVLVKDASAWRAMGRSSAELAIVIRTSDERTGRLFDADLALNDADHDFALEATAGKVDLRAVLLHEAGHFIGLEHSAEPGAIMVASYDPAGLELRADDDAGACALYATPIPQDDADDGGGGCTGGGGSGAGLALGMLGVLGAGRRARVPRR